MAGLEGDLQAAFEALRQEIEVFFEGVHEKLNRLQSAVVVQEILRTKHGDAEVKQEDQVAELFEGPEDPLISVPIEVGQLELSTDRPPPILVEYRKNRTDQETLMQENVFRRYGGLMDAIKEKELRFHGWWMELSTSSVGDETLNRKTLLNTKSSRRISEHPVKVLNFVIHPGGAFRVSWDIIGGFLLLVDAILVPLSIAWNFDIHSQETSGVLLAISFWSGIVYWGSDIPLNFCTAVYFEGNLVSEKGIIACFYLRRWLLPDVGLLTLDIASAFGALVGTSTLRAVRAVRVLRLLRLLKVRRLKDIVEELVAYTGRQSILFIAAIINTAMLITLTSHFLSCAWYFVGRGSQEAGQQSWLEITNAAEVAAFTQYMHSLRYVINAPAPPRVAPDNGGELLADICINIMVLMVLGTAVSKISSTLIELRAMNEVRDRQRREIRLYLTRQNTPFELITRIMKFVDYRFEKTSAISFDDGLISKTLQHELYLSQRSGFLEQIPILSLCQAVFPEVFAEICAMLERHVFERKENVFTTNSWATQMDVTTSGSYTLLSTGRPPEQVQGVRWFSEACLYIEGLIHEGALIAKTFAETFSLEGDALVRCLKNSPGCSRMFIEYARDFLAFMQQSDEPYAQETQIQAGELACVRNSIFQELYPDPRTLFINIDIRALYRGDAEDEEDEETEEKDEEDSNGEIHTSSFQQHARDTLQSEMIMSQQQSWLVRRQNTVREIMNSKRPVEQAHSRNFGLETFVKEVMISRCVPDGELKHRLLASIPELDAAFGPHILFEQADERDRAESSCLSTLALVGGRYEAFTKPQAPKELLLSSQWDEIEAIVRWIDPTPEQVHGALVLLSIRALSKSKMVIRQVPLDSKLPERTLLYLIEHERCVVPSVSFLSDDALNFVKNALEIHEQFNLAQMLQGENVPGSVMGLQDMIHDKGEEVFRFYILFLLGFMSGLQGGEGSRFLTRKNAETTIAGIRMLQQLMKGTPEGIYWGFLSSRARALCHPQETPVDLVLVRLACLARARDPKAFLAVRSSWEALGHREMCILTNHFLADGIKDSTFMFEFLPGCFQHAQRNPIIGLTMMLEVLVDLLSNLVPALPGLEIPSDQKVVRVDLSDMAEFAAAVKNRFVFQTCVARSRFRVLGNRVRVEMTAGNWSRVLDVDSDMTTLAYGVKDIFMRQQAIESLVRHKATNTLFDAKDHLRRERL